MSDGPGPLLGLYVHVPFCEAKCTYCHFAIDPRRPDDARQERYLPALLAEIEAADASAADTLYFGVWACSRATTPSFGTWAGCTGPRTLARPWRPHGMRASRTSPST